MNIFENISLRSIKVWRRNFDIYIKYWKTDFIPPVFEPLLYLFAFGFGLGFYIKGLEYMGQQVNYIKYIAPGIMATAILYRPFFECTYGSFIKMYYQKIFDAILATPLTLEDVVVGELLWGATKSLIDTAIILIIASLFGLVFFPHSLIILPLAFLGGLMFASIAMCFTAVIAYIDLFNIPIFLWVTPMFLFSGTFFPLDQLPAWARDLSTFLPLTHIVNIARAATFGSLYAGLWIDLCWILAITVAAFFLSIYLMKKRLIK